MVINPKAPRDENGNEIWTGRSVLIVAIECLLIGILIGAIIWA